MGEIFVFQMPGLKYDFPNPDIQSAISKAQSGIQASVNDATQIRYIKPVKSRWQKVSQNYFAYFWRYQSQHTYVHFSANKIDNMIHIVILP